MWDMFCRISLSLCVSYDYNDYINISNKMYISPAFDTGPRIRRSRLRSILVLFSTYATL